MKNLARTQIRNLLSASQCMTCASVFDPMSARMAQDIGFKVGILGGSVTSLMKLGVPDINLLTLTELSEQAKRVCSSSQLPVIVDGDSGYGNALNVMRTVRELEYAGAAMITIEDTVLPRPHRQVPLSLSPIDEACSKLKAALNARTDNSTAIFARSHAAGSQSVEQLFERVKAYADCGVDGICLFGLTDQTVLAELASVSDLPIMLINYGYQTLGDAAQLAQNSVRIRFFGHETYEQSVKAIYQSLTQLHSGLVNDEVNAKALVSQYSQSDKYKQLSQQYL